MTNGVRCKIYAHKKKKSKRNMELAAVFFLLTAVAVPSFPFVSSGELKSPISREKYFPRRLIFLAQKLLASCKELKVLHALRSTPFQLACHPAPARRRARGLPGGAGAG